MTSQLGGVKLTINPDGTVSIPIGDKPQLFNAADVVDAVTRKSELEAQQTNLREVTQRAQAMETMDRLLASNPQASALVNAVLRAVATGQPLPTLPAARTADGDEPSPAPGGADPMIASKLPALEQKLADRDQRDALAADEARARQMLEGFGFLKERPRLLGIALQSVMDRRRLEGGDVAQLVRQAADTQRVALEEVLKGKLTDNQTARKLEVEGGEGVPPVATTSEKPATKDSLQTGELRARATARLEGLLSKISAATTGIQS